MVLVHGDTTTTFAGALASFYAQIPVGHVEAGLRTGNLYSPYPEEFNRQAVGIVANYHFAPTETAKRNLLDEGKTKNIFVTGNINAHRFPGNNFQTGKNHGHAKNVAYFHGKMRKTQRRNESAGKESKACLTCLKAVYVWKLQYI